MTVRLEFRLGVGTAGASEDASPRWELVPAWLGSGVWLVRVATSAIDAWAPPGVMLIADEGDDLASWRRASWFCEGQGPLAEHPAAWAPCTLQHVLDEVPPDYEAWALEATEEAIELLKLFADGAPSDDAEADAATTQARTLADEIEQARTGSATSVVALPAAQSVCLDASVFMSACRALSDCDFSRLVSELIGAAWDLTITHSRGALGSDVFVGHSLDRRHVFHVSHDPWAGPAHDWTHGDRVNSADAHRQDVTWWVTSQLVDVLCTPTQDLGLGGFVGATQLQTMLRSNPRVARDHLKLRLAGARTLSTDVSPPPSDFSAQLPQIAETDPLTEARQHLRACGALVISGPPGTGKTTIAQLVLGEAALDGFNTVLPCDNVSNIDRTAGHAVFIDEVPEPTMLLPWIGRAARSDNMLLVAITDREPPTSWRDFTLRLGNYEPLDRSRIIYNQLWPSLVKQPSLLSNSLVEACHRLLTVADFTPGIAVSRLHSLLSRVRAASTIVSGRVQHDVESDVDEDPILSRLRRGWIGAKRDSHLVGS